MRILTSFVNAFAEVVWVRVEIATFARRYAFIFLGSNFIGYLGERSYIQSLEAASARQLFAMWRPALGHKRRDFHLRIPNTVPIGNV